MTNGITLRTRDDLSYGLAICNERVGVGGYDGAAAGIRRHRLDLARAWAERVYAPIIVDSEPFHERVGPIG